MNSFNDENFCQIFSLIFLCFQEMMRTLKCLWMILKCLELGFRKSHFKGERMDAKILDIYKNNSRV